MNCLTTTLSTLVIAWEDYFVNAHDYDIHPYDKAEQLFGDVLSYLNIMIAQDRYLSDDDLKLSSDFISKNMEDSHQDLFQELWTRFNEDDYRKRISDYTYRIKLNNRPLLRVLIVLILVVDMVTSVKPLLSVVPEAF